ncbi:hypothetical protein [Granulicella sp. S156]|uniref:hypothetical protein n=1 Tax=Granulicella sp. S156 TaxID=1747224 RepID=UPI00131EAF1F|nr:hypothetical protein [Granulicella sp. S156]
MRGIGFPMCNHLSDEKLSRLTAGELGAVQRLLAQAHLEKCWQCRLRREALERSALQLAEYRNCLVERIPSNPDRRSALLMLMHQRSETVSPPRESGIALFSVIGKSDTWMTPMLASFLIIACAACLLFMVWRRPTATVSAAELLNRAESADRAVLYGKPGVIYEKIGIRTASGRIEQEIYRDAHRERRRRASDADAKIEAPLQSVLESAQVNLDDPLSIASYRTWYDGQQKKVDAVSQGGGLLTLSTRTPEGSIRQETITVRASDFHPIQRTIRTADDEVIEIAELNYALLDWSSVNETLFEPLAAPRLENPVLVSALPSLPALPTEAELDSAELEALLTLNRLHADEGERISIARTDHGIEVKGIVDSTERKQEVVNGLRMLQHVKAEVLSTAEVRSDTAEALPLQPTSIRAIDPAASPLEEYVDAQPQKKLLLNDAPRDLVDAAFKVRRSADELNTLATKFTNSAEGTTANAAIKELTQSYTQRLSAALDNESSILRQFGLDETANVPASISAQISLPAEARRNDALCQEMVTDDSATRRTAVEIAADIRDSIVRIRSAIAIRGEIGSKESSGGDRPDEQ